jgi:hypothetical protein
LRTWADRGMRTIRPLFRTNGRFGTPQCHGAFQEWIGDPSPGKDRLPLDVRRGTLRTELVERSDGCGPVLIGRPVSDPSSVPGIIARARERKELASQEAETLRAFLVETIKKETYREWLGSSGLAHFFREDDWNDQDNHRKFALYALACFVDFFRPGQIDWRTPNPNDMQLVAKLLNLFEDSKDANKQRKMLRGLFDLKEKLNGLVVESSTGLSRADQELLIECRRLRLKAEARARWLQEKGFKGFGKSALTKYRENPDSMRALISAWTSEILEE